MRERKDLEISETREREQGEREREREKDDTFSREVSLCVWAIGSFFTSVWRTNTFNQGIETKG